MLNDAQAAAVAALILFALWPPVLVVGIAGWRAALMSGGRKITEFPAGTPHGPDPYWRLNRAHLNTVEYLPVFGAIVLGGVVAGVSAPLFGTLALAAVSARMVQSLIHLASGAALAVNLRFLALLVQLVCFIWLAVLVFQTLGIL